MNVHPSGSTSNPEELTRKVKALFRYRHIPDLLSMSRIQDARGFRDKLISLQLSIYHLDHYLETNWEMDKDALDGFWNAIYASLLKLGIMGGKAIDWCSEIRQYQAHELNMRKGRWPVQLDFRQLYYYKSCDVRLIRRIIYEEAPSIGSGIPFDDWVYYDFITEINDDIEDVFEDMETINGNRFLISILMLGKEGTGQEFFREIDALEKEMKDHFGKRVMSPGLADLMAWSETRFNETRELLETRLHRIDPKALKEAAITPYLEQDKHST